MWYIRVESLRGAWHQHQVRVQRPKGAQEGFEIRVTWPAALASAVGVVEESNKDRIRYRTVAGRSITLQLHRASADLTPLVAPTDPVEPGQIIASVVPVTPEFP